MKQLFMHEISDWTSWSEVYLDIDAWKNLIRCIYKKESIPCLDTEPLTPGTNAVFKLGETVVKIFAPKESGLDALSDYSTELFGLRHANALNTTAPRLLASGYIDDKYRFYYLITKHIKGIEFGQAEKDFTDEDKERFGRNLRSFTDRLNTPCERFNNVDVVERAKLEKRWEFFPDSFLRERQEWLSSYVPKECVFVHGDMNPDNVILTPDGKLYIIDFADSIYAPDEYELPAVICELFEFEKPYLKGYLGDNFDAAILEDKLFSGLLIHDFGAGIIKCNLGNPAEITTLNILRQRIAKKLK